ncbi:MAG: DUF6585 family protein [Pyrinomonadaceae bacterium]
MLENNRIGLSSYNQFLGTLQTVYRVERSKFKTIFIHSIICLVFLFGVLTFFGSKDLCMIPVCVILPFSVFCLMVWDTFSTRNDELRIYQNGFTYKGGKKLQTCLWQEIETYRQRRRALRETWEIEQGIFPLDSVKKTNGELIVFTDGLRGTAEICKRYDDYFVKEFRRFASIENENF